MRTLIALALAFVVIGCGKDEEATRLLAEVAETGPTLAAFDPVLPTPTPSASPSPAAPRSGVDDFLTPSVDLTRWDVFNHVTGTFTQGSGQLNFADSVAGNSYPILLSKYKLPAQFEASIAVQFVSGIADTKFDMRLEFNDTANLDDAIFFSIGTALMLNHPCMALYFDNGTMNQPFLCPDAAAASFVMKIAKTATHYEFYLDGAMVGNILISSLPAKLQGNPRLAFEFGNTTSGTMSVSINSMNLGGAVVQWDN